jgi:hypothetical protein
MPGLVLRSPPAPEKPSWHDAQATFVQVIGIFRGPFERPNTPSRIYQGRPSVRVPGDTGRNGTTSGRELAGLLPFRRNWARSRCFFARNSGPKGRSDPSLSLGESGALCAVQLQSKSQLISGQRLLPVLLLEPWPGTRLSLDQAKSGLITGLTKWQTSIKRGAAKPWPQ